MTEALTPAVTDAGELWARRDPDGDVYVERADPVIEISAELLGHAATGGYSNVSWDNDAQVLTFKAANGTWRYHVTGRRPDRPAFRADMISGPGMVPGPVNTTTTGENDGR